MRRLPRPLACALVALALLAGAAPARAGFPPARYFTGFAAAKERLGTLPFLADVAEIEMAGNPDKIYLEDCRAWAARAMEDLARRLTKAGYQVGDQAVPSIGLLVNPEHECCVLGRFKADHRLDPRDRPLARPPFDVHEAFAASPSALAEWDSVAFAVWTADMDRREPDTTLPRADTLADLLGSDVSLVLLGLGTRVPFGRQIKENLLDGGLRGDEPTREFRRIVLAVVDLRRGSLLWWDEDEAENRTFSWPDFGAVAKRFAGHLP